MYIEKVKQMALDNKYTKWYLSICSNAKLNRPTTRKAVKELYGYVEGHHILPKSFKCGGITDAANIVFLTPREHYLCHYLLTKMVTGELVYKMRYAFTCFTRNSHGRHLTSHQYSNALKFTKFGFDDQRKLNISNSRKLTVKHSCVYCGKVVDPGNYTRFHGERCRYNPTLSPTVLINRSISAHKGNAVVKKKYDIHPSKPPTTAVPIKCPHCNKLGTNLGNMHRFHMDRCKHNPQHVNCGIKFKTTMKRVCCVICQHETNSGNLIKNHGVNKCQPV